VFHSVIEILNLLVEIAILVILIIEYKYDKDLNEHVKSMKRRTTKRFDFERLTEGEGR